MFWALSSIGTRHELTNQNYHTPSHARFSCHRARPGSSAKVATPQINAYQELVQIEMCGLCNSTDHKLIEGTMYWAPPFPLC
jgi:hypothetical protein